MNVETRVRELVRACGGRAPAERVVQEALGLGGARGAMARRLLEPALREMRGLALDGDDVVERASAPVTGSALFAMALAPSASTTVLPPLVAWVAVPPSGAPTVQRLQGAAWREGVTALARAFTGAQVLALSAGTARRVLRLGSQLAQLDPDEEPQVVALARVARALGKPVASAEDAAGLVGGVVPQDPESAASLLAELALYLADVAGVTPAELSDIAERDVAAAFDFGERAFGRAELLALPESPGVYLFENEDGEVLYVGKSDNLRRRVASYFAPAADERACRIREQAMGMSFERTGTELSALLREHELIREMQPPLNVQEQVKARGREPDPRLGARSALAIIQPSAEGGAEVVLLERERGATVATVVPDGEGSEAQAALAACLGELRRRAKRSGPCPEFELVLSWLVARGAAASVLDASGPVEETAALALRLARDPELADGRIIPVR